MSRTLLFLALFVVVTSMAMDPLRREFESFKQKFNKQYASVVEEAARFQYFKENMKIAALRQSTNPHASFGANSLADLSAAELKRLHNGESFLKKRAALPRKELPVENKAASNPSKVDWRAKGAVTYVKNQGQCGSCWSFSTTGNIEGQWFLAGNPLVALSEQQLVSCDTIDQGCGGGFQDDAFEWLFFNTNGTITTEEAYPYVSGNGVAPKCRKDKLPFGAQISEYNDIARDETVMAQQVGSGGPLAISLDATSFELYMGGIVTDCISQQIDHAVLIVGYDETNNPPYWIIKNSWGASWGEDGYIRVEKGTNQCLLKNMPTTAVVTKGPRPPAPSPTPSPPSPPSPPPPTPAPSPSNTTFQQITCKDSACTSDCKTQTLPQNECIVTPDGDSAVAVCSSLGLFVTVYPLSKDCTGLSIDKLEQLNTCSLDSDFTYIENVCPSLVEDRAVDSSTMRLSRKLSTLVKASKKN
jgi:cysteine peptidase B